MRRREALATISLGISGGCLRLTTSETDSENENTDTNQQPSSNSTQSATEASDYTIQSDYNTAFANSKNTGSNVLDDSNSLSIQNPEEIWSKEIRNSGRNISSPILGKNLYIGGESVKSIHRRSGQEIWDYTVEDGIAIRTSVAEDSVYAACEITSDSSGRMLAIDAESGDLRWKIDTRQKLRFEPIIIDGTVYFGKRNGDFVALSAADGSEIWSVNLDPGVFATPTSINGKIYVMKSSPYVSTENPGLFCISEDTGEIDWMISSRFNSPVPTTVKNDSIYTYEYGTGIVSISTDDGSLEWQHQNRTLHKPVAGPDSIYVGGDYGDVYKYNSSTGEISWSSSTAASISGAPTLEGDRIIVPSQDGNVYSFSTSDGQLKWRYRPDGTPVSSVSVSDDIIYFISDSDGKTTINAISE